MKRRYRLPRQPTLLALMFVTPLIGCEGKPKKELVAAPLPTPAATVPTAEVLDPATAATLDLVRKSIEQGLDVNKADKDGRTPLMVAAFDGLKEVVALLLEHGAEVDQRDASGRTALMYASSGAFQETVDLLLRKGAQVDASDSVEKWTALMFASAEGQQGVVETLLRHGADPAIADQDGDAAIEHARERGQPHIVALLESWPSKG